MNEDQRTNVDGRSSGGSDRENRTAKQSWHILSVVSGIVAYIIIAMAGEFAIARWVIMPNPELKEMVESAQTQNPGSPDESEKQKRRSLVLGNKLFWVIGFVLAIGAPVLISTFVGYSTGRLREGATTMGLAALFYSLSQQQLLLGLVAGVFFAALGLCGALLGKRIKARKLARSAPVIR